MAFNIVALAMVLAITFMHAIFGFFSGLINVFCTVASAVIAFGFFEPLNDLITKSFNLHPGYTEPVCFIALFILSIIVLRTLADNYIRGNVKVPSAVDWAGAGVCGFINAQIFVGVLVLGVQMLPVRNPETGTVLGYSPWVRSQYDEKDEDHRELAKFDRQHLWTRSDEFAAGLFSLISRGSMRGKTTFASVYPDFPEAVFFSTNTVQPESSPSPYRKERGRDADGFERGLKAEAWWEETGSIEGRYRPDLPTRRQPSPNFERVTFEPAPEMKLIGTRLRLDSTSADRDKRSSMHLFRPTMLRLVGTTRGTPEHYVPRIIANADSRISGAHRIVDFDNNFSLPGRVEDPIYAYFEVDREFTPRFVEYRRHARASLPAAPEEQPRVALTLGGEEESQDSGPGRGPGLTFGRVLEGGSGDNRNLPFDMARRAFQGAGDVTLDGDAFASGRIFGSRARLAHTGAGDQLKHFKLPEGKRLIQVRYKPKEALTVAGQVFNFVGQVNQYRLVDTNGDYHWLSGYYAIVTRARGEQYIEMFFTGGPDDPLSASYNSMLDFRSLERDEINDQDDTIISLLFLVPPNTRFQRVENQTGAGGEVNLRSNRG